MGRTAGTRIGIVFALAGAAAVGFLLRARTPEEGSAPEQASGRDEEPVTVQHVATAPSLQGAPRSPTPPAPPDVSASSSTTYHGNVFTHEGLPAPGARVEAVVGDVVLATAVSDTAGAFHLRIVDAASPPEQTGILRARGADGTVAMASLSRVLHGSSEPGAATASTAPLRIVGPLRLGPSHTLAVHVTGPCRADRSATLWLLPAMVMFSVPWATLQTDTAGQVTVEGLPTGTWSLLAAAPGCGRGRSLVQLPREGAGPVEIRLGDPRTVTVRVRDAGDQSPIAGAVVHVQERLRLPDYSTQAHLQSAPASVATDAEGLARIEGLSGEEMLVLRAEAAGYPSGSPMGRGRGGGGPGGTQVEPGQAEALIELHKPLTIRWPLLNEGIGIPADGTEVAIEPWTNTGRLVVPPRGVIEGQELVVPGWGADGASGYAVLAGRGVARLQASPKETRGHPTAFYPMRTIELVARHADGSPAAGWFLVVRDGGNNPVKPGVKTDAEGRATMDGLYGGPGSLVDVSVSQLDGWGGFVLPLGSVNLLERDGRFEASIPEERTLRIRLTLQGSALPAGLAAWPELNYVRIEAPPAERAAADPGLFEARWRPHKPDAAAVVTARAVGFLAETKQVPASALATGAEVVIDLRPAGSVQIQVKEPEDKRARIAVDRWDAEKGDWGTTEALGVFGSGRGQRPNPNGIVEVQGLDSGRYRAVDTASGLTSEPFEVRAGGPPTRIVFDVSASGWARGRVVLPEGVPFAGTSVGEPDGTPSNPLALWGQVSLPGAPVNPKDGTFWIRIPGTRPVTLRVFHAVLQPHPSLGQVTITRPQEGLELHAVRGASARVRFTTPARVDFNPGQARPIAVRLYPGRPEGPGTSLRGMLDGAHQAVEFGGYAPGTYTVWIDAPGYAPVVLEGVVLGTADADLGEVALSPGSALELKVGVKDGQSPPRYTVWAQALDEPTYTRNADASGSTITLRGLGAGRFRVQATAYNSAAPGLDEEIVFDGTSKVVRTLDAR